MMKFACAAVLLVGSMPRSRPNRQLRENPLGQQKPSPGSGGGLAGGTSGINPLKNLDPAKVLQPVTDYFEKPAKNTRITFCLDYYNTSSAKCLIDIFKKLQSVHSAGTSAIEVAWEYQEFDEDMQESGEDFKAQFTFPVNMVPIK